MDIAATFDREPFRHTDPKYKCCCGLMHVKDACKIIAALGCLVVLLQILNLIGEFTTISWWAIFVHLILILIIAAIVACLIYAMKSENEKLLIPFMILLCVGIFFCLILLVFSIWSLVDPHSNPARVANNIVITRNDTAKVDQGMEDNQNAIRVTSALGCTAAVIGIALCAWFFMVVYKYFRYLREMKEARNPRNVVHHDIQITTLKKGIQ